MGPRDMKERRGNSPSPVPGIGIDQQQKSWRILMISADPTANHKLKLQAEERAIRKSLSMALANVDITFDVLPAATIDDLAECLLRKSASGMSYDIIHFSGHCDQHHHMVQLIFAELEKQHGKEVVSRFRASHDATKGIHELAVQVSRHLELQAGMYMDELYYSEEDDEDGLEQVAEPDDDGSDTSNSSQVEANEKEIEERRETPEEERSEGEDMESMEENKEKDITSDIPKGENSSAWRSGSCKKRLPRSKSFDNLTISVEHSSHWRDGRSRKSSSEEVKRCRSLSPMFKVHLRRKTDVEEEAMKESDKVVERDGESEQEARSEERQLLVFAPHISPPNLHFEQPRRFPSDQDSLVLRLPDVTPRHQRRHGLSLFPDIVDEDEVVPTKDIVLTKQQILEAGVGSLAFETGTGTGMNFVGAKAFAALISPYALDLNCVLLNACHSQLTCEQILSVGIPFAVCSRGRMSDKSALNFSQGFYEAIAFGHDIERAFLEGQNRVSAHNHRLNRAHTQSGSIAIVPQSISMPPAEEGDNQVCLMRANGRMVLEPVSVRQHVHMSRENVKLKSMIHEGVKILSEKDREIENLKAKLAKLEKLEAEIAASQRSPGSKRDYLRNGRTVRDSPVLRMKPKLSAGSGSRSSAEKVSSSRSKPAQDGDADQNLSASRSKSVASTGQSRGRSRKRTPSPAEARAQQEVADKGFALPPWIPAGSGGDSHRFQGGNKENCGTQQQHLKISEQAPPLHGTGKRNAGTKSMPVSSTTVFTAGATPHSQNHSGLGNSMSAHDHSALHGTHQPKPNGFGSSVPRFSANTAVNPARYETTSPRSKP